MTLLTVVLIYYLSSDKTCNFSLLRLSVNKSIQKICIEITIIILSKTHFFIIFLITLSAVVPSYAIVSMSYQCMTDFFILLNGLL